MIEKAKEIYKKIVGNKLLKNKKVVITSLVLLILLYKLIFSGGIGIFDNREKIVSKGGEYEENIGVENEEGKGRDFSSKEDGSKKDNADLEEISVYVSGEVSSPGVIKLKNGSRLDDAIKKLGGLTKDADANRINLAMRLEDAGHYIIPKKGENIQVQQDMNASGLQYQDNNSGSTTQSNNSDGKIDINTADEKKLEEIPGVGPATAKKIVDYRNREGKFKDVEDLKNVTGIGDKKFENMKEYVVAR